MRIIAGKYKGINIRIPDTRETRPTTDRVRESMFSSIISLYGPLDNASILDAFAGSGALGFESVSRGAKSLVAFESNKKIFENLNKNHQMFKDDKCIINLYYADILKANLKFLPLDSKFDILFFDPPYSYEPKVVVDIIKKLKSQDLLNEGCLVVYEHSAKQDSSSFVAMFYVANFQLKNDKIYGDIAISYFM